MKKEALLGIVFSIFILSQVLGSKTPGVSIFDRPGEITEVLFHENSDILKLFILNWNKKSEFLKKQNFQSIFILK